MLRFPYILCCTSCISLFFYCCWVAKWCLSLHYPMECSAPGFPVLHHLWAFAQTHVRWVSDALYLILCHPLLLLLSVLPSIRVFFSESALCIKWPRYWSFSISPSNAYSGLMSFRMDWLDLLAVQGTLKSSAAPQFESISPLALSLLYGPTLKSVRDYWKDHSFDYTDLYFTMQCH